MGINKLEKQGQRAMSAGKKLGQMNWKAIIGPYMEGSGGKGARTQQQQGGQQAILLVATSRKY